MNQIQQRLELEKYLGKTYHLYDTTNVIKIERPKLRPCRDRSGNLSGCKHRPPGTKCNIPQFIEKNCFWRVELGREVNEPDSTL